MERFLCCKTGRNRQYGNREENPFYIVRTFYFIRFLNRQEDKYFFLIKPSFMQISDRGMVFMLLSRFAFVPFMTPDFCVYLKQTALISSDTEK